VGARDALGVGEPRRSDREPHHGECSRRGARVPCMFG